ncbi:MAG TPA: hypothetical protein VFD08_01445 [Clostridia bacterium]|nr:hypothetical protein [Clostridia bacterium]
MAKKNPRMKQIQEDMAPGSLTLVGFLGDDTRSLDEIIRQDEALLQKEGIEISDMVKALKRYTFLGVDGLGDPVDSGDYIITVDHFRGWQYCPFKHKKRVSKRNTTLFDKVTKKTLYWSDLSLHLIEEHSFFQGKGSSFRMEPQDLIDVLRLKKTE